MHPPRPPPCNCFLQIPHSHDALRFGLSFMWGDYESFRFYSCGRFAPPQQPYGFISLCCMGGDCHGPLAEEVLLHFYYTLLFVFPCFFASFVPFLFPRSTALPIFALLPLPCPFATGSVPPSPLDLLDFRCCVPASTVFPADCHASCDCGPRGAPVTAIPLLCSLLGPPPPLSRGQQPTRTRWGRSSTDREGQER